MAGDHRSPAAMSFSDIQGSQFGTTSGSQSLSAAAMTRDRSRPQLRKTSIFFGTKRIRTTVHLAVRIPAKVSRTRALLQQCENRGNRAERGRDNAYQSHDVAAPRRIQRLATRH